MSIMRAGLPLAIVLLLLPACLAIRCSDPMREARIRIDRGDLMEAMLVLESVGVDDPRHVDAQQMAADVEARIRLALNHVRDGLELRAHGDGLGAIASFSVALAVWPQCPEAASLLESTRSRRGITVHARPVASGAETADTAQPLAGASRPLCGQESDDDPVAVPPVVVLPVAVPPVAVPPVVVRAPGAPGAVDQSVPAIARAEAAPAPAVVSTTAPGVASLPAPDSRLPDSRRVPQHAPDVAAVDQAVPIRVEPVTGRQPPSHEEPRGQGLPAGVADSRIIGLGQRALMRYGRGDLSGAIGDWGEILRLVPGEPTVQRYLQIAHRELQRPARR